jgi:hypothetical protein
VTAERDIDQLYGARPEDFTARRTKLVAAAKKRGDADEAKVIAAARRPTTAAWVVNALVRSDDSVRTRLADLGERLRAAHASMDGARIRELSAAQRKLIDELLRAGLDAAELSDPSATLRDDVTGTLQAAIADPEVAARLGTLAKPERWSGFGEFGASTAVMAEQAPDAGTRKAPERATVRKPATTVERGPTAAEVKAARKRQATATAAVKAAEAARADAVEALDDRKAKVKSARRRYEKILETLDAAEREVDSAEAELDAAGASAGRAADDLAAAKAELAEADAALADLG